MTILDQAHTERETVLYQQRVSKLFLEAAIGSLLQSHLVGDVITLLRSQADQLTEFERPISEAERRATGYPS